MVLMEVEAIPVVNLIKVYHKESLLVSMKKVVIYTTRACGNIIQSR